MLEAQDLNLPLYSHNYEIVYYLGKFIKRNKNLIHLDLSHTQLTEGMLWWLGSTLTRAPSLASLHLSGNPGITSELKRQLQLRIRCKKITTQNKIILEQDQDHTTSPDVKNVQKLKETMQVRLINRAPTLDS